nr:hypothetical protein [Halomonas sp. UBA3074]
MNRELVVRELQAVFKVLSEDIEGIRLYGQEHPTDLAHRTLLRTHFSFIEGMAYQLRQVALYSASEHLGFFSPEELAILKEEKYGLNKKGEIEVQGNFQKLRPAILFSIRCYCKIHGAEFEPDTSRHGWDAIGKYQVIRNQLAHPKSTADLKITDEKLKCSQDAAEWFKGTLLAMFHACDEADAKYEVLKKGT